MEIYQQTNLNIPNGLPFEENSVDRQIEDRSLIMAAESQVVQEGCDIDLPQLTLGKNKPFKTVKLVKRSPNRITLPEKPEYDFLPSKADPTN